LQLKSFGWVIERRKTPAFFIGLLLMKHVLDNPAFNALNTGNKSLAKGNSHIKYLNKEVSPFIGFDDNTDLNFHKLYDLIDHDLPVAFVSPAEREAFGPWQAIYYVMCLQMVYNGAINAVDESNIIELTADHIPRMLALTKLTNPGPFSERTLEFGHYRGIFDGHELVAMAGQRMNPLPYAEISAVCTHPDYTGQGYAKLLVQQQINRISNEGNIPFLHVRCDNPRAIQIYKNMGFETRAEMHFYILKK
jgi:ribosomal protein S18 acetylase RimI-like enzyme